MKTFLPALLCLAPMAAIGAEPPRYVQIDKDGRLAYAADARGDRLPDFSHCGYGGGGVPIPDVPARVVVAPAPGDATLRIQAALDHVGRLKPDEGGFRGAVLLTEGRHEVAGSLRLGASGVVLRGQGDATILVATGTGRRTLIRVGGDTGRRFPPGDPHRVVDAYVPVGSRRLELDGVEGLRPGVAVVVTRPGTPEWVSALGMDRFPLGYEGSLDWRPAVMEVRWDRVVNAVDGPVVTLDAPITTALDASLGGGTVRVPMPDGHIERVAVENLRCESSFDRRNPLDEQHAWVAVGLDAVKDAWVRRVTAAHFAGSAVRLLDGCRSATVQDCASVRPVSEDGGQRRQAFLTSGQRTLFLRCRSERGRHDFAVGALAAGPNAFVQCEANGALDFSGPVESWASGVLYDNVKVDGAGLSLTNRETAGQGAGWASANGVLWQCSASVVTCRNPPGAHNWAVGCWGQFFGDGGWQAPNEFVKPESLYRAQLAERLGPGAVAAIEPRAIPSDPGDARPLADVWPGPAPSTRPTARPLAVRNGWLTRDGELLTGGRVGTTWWRGSILPTRAREFGIGLTRFVPGRDGDGFTDDLDALSDRLVATGKAALEHHWGLWYDRRRDDHQMVRRADGDVWPPFYESPWARSGRGTAWDGLSKYDLGTFNPWYFDRLDTFAGLCDRKGLALFHQAYFQHNILEAGAHWADFPWRPANCLQDTGFPEPPPYAGGKRVFMAEVFYDIDHPVRRALHREYIRKCLDTLGGHPNVVFFTGEEYTGPLPFMRFWLDTVTEWEKETGRDVLVGLSCTKDVQDAILADPARGPAVSAVELKYWWYSSEGTLYAPEGGKNLAPRQQLREWKGPKKRSVEQTARQVREYRARYPEKAVLFTGGPDDGWAVLAAGGSLPDLPRRTDPELRAVLPRLRPFGTSGADARQWVLADPGHHYLAYAGPGQALRIDLNADRTRFALRRIDPVTGMASSSGEPVEGGRVLEIPAAASGPTVIWLSAPATADESPSP